MANAVKKGGLRLYRQYVDAPLMWCVIPSTDSTIVGRGDVVKIAGSSAQIGAGPYGPTVARVAAGDACFGVVEGVPQHFVTSSGMTLDTTVRSASKTMYVLVRKCNYQDEYVVCEDGTWAVADVGENANLTGNGGGTSVTDADSVSGLSTMMLDTSTHATGATLQVRVLGFAPYPDNTPASANADLIVTFNNIQSGGGTGVAGV